jgi:hypothetical protein
MLCRQRSLLAMVWQPVSPRTVLSHVGHSQVRIINVDDIWGNTDSTPSSHMSVTAVGSFSALPMASLFGFLVSVLVMAVRMSVQS